VNIIHKPPNQESIMNPILVAVCPEHGHRLIVRDVPDDPIRCGFGRCRHACLLAPMVLASELERVMGELEAALDRLEPGS